MASEKSFTPPHYEQPVPNFIERSLNGPQEYVDFIPESHLRIWYNNQTEGYANHYHNALEIIVCAENQYIIITNNRTYTLNVGDILIIPPFMLHELHSRPSGARFIYLIDIDMLRCFQDFKTLDPVLMDPYLCTASTCPEIYRHIYDSLMQMADTYFSHKIFWETSIYSTLLDIMLTIGVNYYTKTSTDDANPSGDKQTENYVMFTNLLNFIDAHYADDLTLEQAADYIGFSKYHFTRLFKQHTNTTFHNYLCHKRIQAAQAMLTADMNLPVTDIAFRIGFNNLTTFSRCFNRYTGCSPTEYRNKLRQEEI
ncbi:MAG: AraC family transcriptional regulator [Lachnospiraceae bacterium]|nr:AraC family transcriptional regulator [Lachnospiraceae bacterium]